MMRLCCADRGLMCNPRRLGMAFNPPWISTKAGRIKYSTCAIDGSEDHGSSLKGQERVVAIEKAKSAALRLQGKRSHSRFELTQKLLKYGFQDDIITPALDRLAQVGLQSDGEFAEIFARSKWRQAKWGPSRLKMELARRKVPEEDTRAALQSIFGDGGLDVKGYVQDDDQHDGEVGEGDNAVKALLRAARDRYQMTNGLSKETRKRRIFNWLQRRGHRAEDAIKILHLLEREQTDEEGQLT